ncbi:hypothetical protein PAECIP111802_01176 [Paenibacillus allorhizosphaerae]|uniref:Uncharacterized protein n=1 Tax=Paenibacillus allorhizosphaerae TaxID=2849866 RepID=A0ABM8VCZ1_9BACL|nr:hypothetical protein PAECIP111802_01176 [Paenibacillus allorhizosphaerae]
MKQAPQHYLYHLRLHWLRYDIRENAQRRGHCCSMKLHAAVLICALVQVLPQLPRWRAVAGSIVRAGLTPQSKAGTKQQHAVGGGGTALNNLLNTMQ